MGPSWKLRAVVYRPPRTMRSKKAAAGPAQRRRPRKAPVKAHAQCRGSKYRTAAAKARWKGAKPWIRAALASSRVPAQNSTFKRRFKEWDAGAAPAVAAEAAGDLCSGMGAGGAPGDPWAGSGKGGDTDAPWASWRAFRPVPRPRADGGTSRSRP